MTLLKQNEKLAKFMGLEKHHIYECNISYDQDWNLLMPVVEKLWTEHEIAIHIDEDRVYLHWPDRMMTFKNAEWGSKIATVYIAVCEAVNWIENKTAKAL